MSEQAPLATFYAYEKEDVHRFAHVHDAFSALNEVAERLRHMQKYEEHLEAEIPIIDRIVSEFWEIMNDYKIDPAVD